MLPYLLETRNLVKSYGTVEAVRGVDLQVKPGICFGLLGPNGAGKTTTIELIEGILKPTSGEILFRGEPISGEFREKIGIQFQHTSLPDFLTVREVLELFRSFYLAPLSPESLRDRCALTEFYDRDASKLSGGQRQRLLLALGLINDPELIFLDEPTTGLDPQARRNFWELIRGLKAEGKTIVITTHYMEEAYELCDEVCIMDHGKIIARGEPSQLLRQHFQGLSILIDKADVRIPHSQIPGKVFERETQLEIQTERVNETIQALLSSGSPLQTLKVRPRDLEDLFLELTGKDLRA